MTGPPREQHEIQWKKTQVTTSNPYAVPCLLLHKKDANESNFHPFVYSAYRQKNATGAMKDADSTSAFYTPCDATTCQIVGG